MRALIVGLMIWFAAAGAQAQAAAHLTDAQVTLLITSSCRFYSGQSLADLADPMSHEIMNPLLASPLGRATYSKSLGQAFWNMNYTALDTRIEDINNSKALDTALQKCYGNDHTAKVGFVILMNQIQFQAKADAILLSIGAFYAAEATVVRVVSKVPLLMSLSAWSKRVGAMKVAAGAVLADAAIVTADAVNRFLHPAPDFAKSIAAQTHQDMETAHKVIQQNQAVVSTLRQLEIHDLEQNIARLRSQSGSITDPARRAQYNQLMRRAQVTLAQLKAS